MISNVEVYGISGSFRASKFPMKTDIDKCTTDMTDTIRRLAASDIGSGHDNFLNGIIVQFDLTFTKQAWSQLQRYHFIDFVSCQSAIHRITKFDLDQQYVEWTDHRIIEIVKELQKKHNDNPTDENFYRLIYSSPAGLKLTARMTTNYRQLKTIYRQRRNHRLPEWKEFCRWIESLPYSELITG